MPKCFIWLNEKKQCINEFKIGYIINPNLNINEVFREQVEICMKHKFGPITQPHIKATFQKRKQEC